MFYSPIQEVNESQTNISNDPIQNNENCLKSFLKNHKKLLLIISSLLIAIIIAVIIIIVKLKKSGEDIVKNIDSTVPSDDPFKTDEPSYKPSDKPIKSENINTDFPSHISILTNRPKDIETTTTISTSYIINEEKEKEECLEGYFIPDDANDTTLNNCVKCSLERCAKCKGTYMMNALIVDIMLEFITEVKYQNVTIHA